MPALAADGDRLSLLLIEDNPADAELFETRLEETTLRPKTTICPSLGAALEALHEQRFDVIVSDLGLSDAWGLEAVSKLLPASPEAALIVLSGGEDRRTALEAVRVGAQDYLGKGQLTPASLERSVRYALERKSAQRELLRLARIDHLTGLANRNTFVEQVDLAVARAKRSAKKLAVLFIDLDHFKEVNDAMGHMAADELITRMGERFREFVRKGDLVARLGGDEFAVLLDDLPPGADVVEVAERLRATLAEPLEMDTHRFLVTASIGVATFPSCGQTALDLLKAADTAMYDAKARGRNTIVQADRPFSAPEAKRLSIAAELAEATKAKKFEVHYQPQLDLETDDIVAYEALLRWTRDDGTPVPPTDFVPVLERAGLILEVGAWVLDESCRQVAAWSRLAGRPLRAAVNISPKQFESDRLVATVRSALQAHGLQPDQLELEITEGLLMRNVQRTRLILAELKRLGVRIAIDDFGTGFSSLAYLQQFDIDVLKVDRSFVEAITGAGSDSVAEAIVALGRRLGMEVVAEGIERPEQILALRKEGCPLGQGFLLGRPQAAEQLQSCSVTKSA